MSTFREIYCAKHQCTADDFSRRVFWRTLYPHARVLAPLLLLVNYEFFAPDRTLIACVADAATMKRIREEVRDYFWDSNNRSWLRETARIRISGQRLKDLARDYLPEGSTLAPFPRSDKDTRSAF